MCFCMALFSRYLPWPFFLSGVVGRIHQVDIVLMMACIVPILEGAALLVILINAILAATAAAAVSRHIVAAKPRTNARATAAVAMSRKLAAKNKFSYYIY